MWEFVMRILLPILNVVFGIGNAVCLWVLLWPDVWLAGYTLDKEVKDTLHLAVSIGRFDFAAVLLAIVALLLGLFALVSFSYFKHGSEQVAREVAEKAANKRFDRYLRKDFPKLLIKTLGFTTQNPQLYGRFSAAQERGEGENNAGGR